MLMYCPRPVTVIKFPESVEMSGKESLSECETSTVLLVDGWGDPLGAVLLVDGLAEGGALRSLKFTGFRVTTGIFPAAFVVETGTRTMISSFPSWG